MVIFTSPDLAPIGNSYKTCGNYYNFILFNFKEFLGIWFSYIPVYPSKNKEIWEDGVCSIYLQYVYKPDAQAYTQQSWWNLLVKDIQIKIIFNQNCTFSIKYMIYFFIINFNSFVGISSCCWQDMWTVHKHQA